MPVQSRPFLLERIYYQQYESNAPPSFVPHYHQASGDLIAWRWPVSETGIRITTTGLAEYRITHKFRFPCCLCATDKFEASYTESAIYIPVFGSYAGKMVSGCATNSCGYLIDIERLYLMLYLNSRMYPKRGMIVFCATSRVPNPDAYSLAATALPPPPVYYKPTIGQRGVPNVYARLPYTDSPNKASPSSLDQLLSLDSISRPGLSEIEFRRLFTKCRCGKVTTRRVFKEHICFIAQDPPTILDLTNSDNDSVIDLTADD